MHNHREYQLPRSDGWHCSLTWAEGSMISGGVQTVISRCSSNVPGHRWGCSLELLACCIHVYWDQP